MKTLLSNRKVFWSEFFVDGLSPIVCLFGCILCGMISSVTAQTTMIPVPKYYVLAAPKRAESAKLNSTKVPFGSFWSGCRYQQVFDATLFTNLPPGGGFVFGIYYRPGCGGRQGTFMTNTVVRMCTTDRKPGELSAVLDENYGQLWPRNPVGDLAVIQ